MDSRWPPKNRRKTGLPFLRIELVWEGGKVVMGPNFASDMAAQASYPMGAPLNGQKSVVSGEPAYLLRVDDLEIALAFDELDRFLRHDLLDFEYFMLRSEFGMFLEIHDDFYDVDDGSTRQPMAPSRNLTGVRDFFISKAESAKMEADLAPAAVRSKAPGSA